MKLNQEWDAFNETRQSYVKIMANINKKIRKKTRTRKIKRESE